MAVSVTLACGAYDRTLPLALGDVRPEGVDLTYLPMQPEEVFWRMTRHGEFDAAEMSMSSYLVRLARGDRALVAIPVFTSRMFRHSCVWINADSGIQRPEDLKAKRMGVPEYQVTAVVWIRGFLEDDYGVKPSDMRWYRGGLLQPGRVEKLEISPPGVELNAIDASRTLSDMLATGEIDALMAPRPPSTYDGQHVRRLFEDFKSVEADYYARTRIFPIMHTVVIRRDLLERHPWLARSLYDALSEAKQRTLSNLTTWPAALVTSLPWQLAETEATQAVMGDDFWPYGLEANRKTLETLARYHHEQGLSARQVAVDEMFAESTLDEYVI
jgi:4,5-dihydroxyphthalate decarboxylase